MKLEVLNYDKKKAKFKFVLFKVLELFGIFLFLWGFETLGKWSYENLQAYLTIDFVPITYFEFWLYGFLTFIIFVASILVVFIILYLAYLLVREWAKINWRWAKISAEDETAKVERILEQGKLTKMKEIKEMKKKREKFGYCKGDIAIRKRKGDFGKIGEEYEIKNIWIDGNFDVEGQVDISPEKFKFIKKELPKAPKLNKVRAKEVMGNKK